MKAKIKFSNIPVNQEKARLIRDANRRTDQPVNISFSKDLTEIFFEGERIWIPEKTWFNQEMLVEGQVKNVNNGIEIHPPDKGKTINLHLDAELVAELNEIKQHVMSKTQHDIVLEIFKKGLDQYKDFK